MCFIPLYQNSVISADFLAMLYMHVNASMMICMGFFQNKILFQYKVSFVLNLFFFNLKILKERF